MEALRYTELCSGIEKQLEVGATFHEFTSELSAAFASAVKSSRAAQGDCKEIASLMAEWSIRFSENDESDMATALQRVSGLCMIVAQIQRTLSSELDRFVSTLKEEVIPHLDEIQVAERGWRKALESYDVAEARVRAAGVRGKVNISKLEALELDRNEYSESLDSIGDVVHKALTVVNENSHLVTAKLLTHYHQSHEKLFTKASVTVMEGRDEIAAIANQVS